MDKDCSSDSGFVENTTSDASLCNNDTSVITEKMLLEESMVEKENLMAEQQLRKKIWEEEKKQQEETCFKRLHLLLSRSSVYAKFMAEKLQKYEEKQKKMNDRINQRDNAKSLNQENINGNLNNSPNKRGIKRKANETKAKKKAKMEANMMDVFKKQNMDGVNLNSKDDQNGISHSDLSVCNLNRQPKLLCGTTMRDYQIDGYEWLKTLFENGVNGILADEMGLGKTIQSIAFIAHLIEMGVSGPFFVCGPLSTVPNWYNEFQMFAPDIPVMIYHGDKAERQELRNQIYKRVRKNGVYCFPVIITSYQIALIDTLKLASITWKLMIIDEAHRIKNYQCKLIEALKTYNVVHRLLLTGTPLQNNLSELWSLLNFILPEIFDDLKIFQSWFDITRLTQHGATQEIIAQEQEKQIVSTIHQILTPFLLRRTKADVELCLPSKKVVLVKAPMTQLQQKYYSGVLNESIRKFFEKENKNAIEVVDGHPKRKSKKTNFFGCENSEDEFTIEKIPPSNSSFRIENSEINLKLTNIMMCLRKICCHPYMISYPLDDSYEYLVDENLVKTSGKLLVLDNLLPHLKKRGHKVLIFSQFVTLLHILEDYCTFRNYKFTKLYGNMNLEEREGQLKLFNEDSSVFLFLISTRAGGLGINLTSADTVILYDTDWNPQADLQAQDRCHRIGQKKPVVVYRLIIPNTVDEKIFTYAETKRKLEKAIIQKGRFSSKNGISKVQRAITKEELLELLESSDVNGFINADNFVIPPKELESILDRSDMV